MQHLTRVLMLTFWCMLFLPRVALAFPADFDGDGKNDLVVWRPSGPSQGTWYVYPSGGSCPPCFSPVSGGCSKQWGLAGDTPISGDYDGDGKADPTVWRPTTNTWWVHFSSLCGSASVVLGTPTDLPDEEDINNDGVSDILLYRASTKTWYYRSSVSPYPVTTHQFSYTISGGATFLDPVRTVSQNYVDANGHGDLTRYDPALQSSTHYGVWAKQTTPNGGNTASIFAVGAPPADVVPVAQNYGGVVVNLADYVTWHRPTGNWTIRYNGGSPGNQVIQWGLNVDIPVGGDYDGDGLADLTVWRNSPTIAPGTWYVKPSTGACPPFLLTMSGGCYRQWGLPNDIPVG